LEQSLSGRGARGPRLAFFGRRLFAFFFGAFLALVLAALQLVLAFLLAGQLLGALFPAITVSGQLFPPGLKIAELRGSADRRSSAPFGFAVLKFDDVLSLRAFLTLNHLKFHFLVFCQGPKAFTLNGAMMYKDIRAIGPGNKAKSLGVIKPFNRASFLHY